MIIQPGTDIGRYHILEQLGEGGMAVVYKAFDTRLETEVAVKVIRVGDITPNALPRILKRFQIEAKKMAQMTHPNIVRVLDYGEFKGAPYLVMPYLPGGPLKNKLGKPMDGREAIRLLLPIADAIGYAHKKGIIHRDIKPSNILITEEGQTMLSDFGVAKVMESEETQDLSSSGMGVGTPEYMAPEVGMQKEFDYRADIYSLGIVLYEMVTGRRPFRADTPVAVLLKHATEPLPRPSSFNPGVPEEIERLLFKALAKNPKDRFSDMGSFAKAMEQVKTHKLRKTTEPAPKYHVLPEANRQSSAQVKKPLEKKWLYGLLGTVGLVLVAYLAIIAIWGLDLISLKDTGKADALATSENAEGKIYSPTKPSVSNATMVAVSTPTIPYPKSYCFTGGEASDEVILLPFEWVLERNQAIIGQSTEFKGGGIHQKGGVAYMIKGVGEINWSTMHGWWDLCDGYSDIEYEDLLKQQKISLEVGGNTATGRAKVVNCWNENGSLLCVVE